VPNRARQALLGAAVSAVLLGLTWLLALHLGFGQRADQSVLRGFQDLGRPAVNSLAAFIAELCNPIPWVFFAAVPVAVALLRRRPRVAIAVVAVLLGANATTQLLKPLLAVPRAHDLLTGFAPVTPASWPSGHATAAMSLALASVLAAPPRWRPWVAAAGAAFAVAVSYSFLTLGWHYPSDVLGGFLVACTWTLAVGSGLLVLQARDERPARARPRIRISVGETLAPPGLALLVGLCLAGLVVLVRPHEVVSYARAHQAFVVGAAAIGVLGLVVATAVSLVFRQR
jgi:membrane-associated phospholipid phosphatase